MTGYRLYRLDGDGKVLSAQWLEAADDASALDAAAGRCEGRPAELWQGKRLVARIDPHARD